jgi:hypothetical protein
MHQPYAETEPSPMAAAYTTLSEQERRHPAIAIAFRIARKARLARAIALAF